jgi:lipopolysaccharide export system permease protein
MKKIIFRKLLIDCLTFFFLALFGISTIIWVFQAVNFLDIMIEDGRNYNVYFSYTLLNFPKIISRILPFALFFSFSYTFIKYEANNELIIFWNHGVSKISVVNFFFWISILIMLVPNFTIVNYCSKISRISKIKIKSF